MTEKEKRTAARKYLLQIKYMDERVKELQEHVEALRERLILPSHEFFDSVQRGCSSDSFEKKMAKSLDKQTELADLIFQYEIFRDRTLVQLLQLKSDNESEMVLLYNTYFKFMKLLDVAKKMELSKQYVFHLHTIALVHFYDQYLDKDKTERKTPE